MKLVKTKYGYLDVDKVKYWCLAATDTEVRVCADEVTIEVFRRKDYLPDYSTAADYREAQDKMFEDARRYLDAFVAALG